ncbi:MAG: hypothetical protein AAGF11_40310 [Myxococcota bacterium]
MELDAAGLALEAADTEREADGLAPEDEDALAAGTAVELDQAWGTGPVARDAAALGMGAPAGSSGKMVVRLGAPHS